MFFVLFATLGNGIAQTGRFTLSSNEIRVKDVLKIIESQSNYRFFYNDDLSDVNKTITIALQDAGITEVLETLFDKTKVAFKFLENNLIVISPADLMKKQLQISGTVTDLISGEPLAGVYVKVAGTENFITTDYQGRYTIGAEDNRSVLTFSFVGYITESIQVGNQVVHDLALKPEIQSLDEVVVIGYGVQKKSVVTGSISEVKSEDFQNNAITRAEQALLGRTSGVQVISNSGAPGAGMKVRIRGISTNGNSNPLYIVDGIRYTELNNLDPNDISSIEVLKDAASAAIYGAEGGNGVVLITTKKGIPGKGTLTYDFQTGMQQLAKKPQVMSAPQFVQYMSEAGLMNNPGGAEETDWVDEIFTRAPMTRHHLSFSGGNSRMTFMLGLSNLSHDGIVTGSQDRFKRHTAVFNSDYSIKDWLKIGQALSYAHTEHAAVTESSEYGSVITNAILFDPLTPVSYRETLPDPVSQLIHDGKKLMKDDQGNYYGISQVMVGEIINPFVSRDATQGRTRVDNLFGNLYMDVKPFRGFTFTSRLGLDVSALNYHSYNPEYYYNIMAYRDLAVVSDAMSIIRYWQWENFANYTRAFADHAMTFLIGMSASETKGRVLAGSAGPLVRDTWSFAELDFVTSPSATDVVTGGQVESHKLSYFTRFNYSYKGKYLAQGSIRRDAAGEETLPRENRWGVFPSFSAGWVISKERFFPEFFIDFLKVRASWGLNGSLASLGTNYSYDNALVSTMVYPINNNLFVTGTKPARLYNPDLKWETSEQVDIAVDLRAFSDRLTFTVDYYIKKTRDLLTSYTPPIESGNDPSMINAGDVLNRGFEFDLGFRHKTGKLSYAINANLSTLHNEVTYLNPTISRMAGSTVNLWTATAFERGRPVWYFRGYKTNGINHSTGDPVFVDTDGKEGISSDDQTMIGNPIPTLTYGGNVNLAYGPFDLDILLQGQHGNDIIMGMIRTDRPILNKFEYFYTNRWTTENTHATMPRAGADARSWNSDLLVFDGSFLRIKQIQIGFSVPTRWMQKISGSSFRIYLSLEDYWTFTRYPGLDPEAGSSNVSSLGIDRGQFPTARKLMAGASVTF